MKHKLIKKKRWKVSAIANKVRGVIDGWDFKQYVLGILFYRFISENLTREFNYEIISDEEAIKWFKNDAITGKGRNRRKWL